MSGRWWRVGRACLALVLLAVPSGCGFFGDDGERPLVVYSAGPRPLAEAICRAFEEEYGVRVNLFAATNGQIMAKLEAEKYRPQADVVMLASRVAAEALKTQNRLLPLSLDNLPETRTEWHDPDGFYLATSAGTVGIAVRQGAIDGPISWEDLLNSGGEFGCVTMPSPSRSGSAGDFLVAYLLHEKDGGWEAFRQSRRDGLDFAAANNQAITGLLIGSYDVIIGAVDYLIYRQIANGAELAMKYPSPGGVVVPRPIAVLKTTQSEDTARAFVDFYFSQAMQEKVAAQHLIPARKDVPLSETRRADGVADSLPVDYTAALEAYRPILRRFQLEIERAAVIRTPAE